MILFIQYSWNDKIIKNTEYISSWQRVECVLCELDVAMKVT